MIAPEYCQLMARYNRWMNERLYALLAELSDAERKRDRGAFFGSMHGTLNHLLWGDRTWLGRFIDEPGRYRYSLAPGGRPDRRSAVRPHDRLRPPRTTAGVRAQEIRRPGVPGQAFFRLARGCALS